VVKRSPDEMLDSRSFGGVYHILALLFLCQVRLPDFGDVSVSSSQRWLWRLTISHTEDTVGTFHTGPMETIIKVRGVEYFTG
jgi:hypothetical protein